MSAHDAVRWILVGLSTAAFLAAVWLISQPPVRVLAATASAAVAFWAARPLWNARPQLDPAAERGRRERQYHRLRTSTLRMLDSVRRMNAVAVAAEEGRLPVRDAFGELTRIETEMKYLVEEMRDVAGKEG